MRLFRTSANILIALLVFYSVVELILYGYEFSWTGFAETPKPLDGFFPANLGWDWLDLLIIPAVIAIGGFFLARSERATDREIAVESKKEDREIATERQEDLRLQTYLDRMSAWLLQPEFDLLNSKADDKVRNMARSQTVIILSSLSSKRKRSILELLFESDLINVRSRGEDISNPIVNLSGADFSEAYLSGLYLYRADLSQANLSKSDMRGANLHHASLFKAKLGGADLRGANLLWANLDTAVLDNSDLTGADLTGAKLTSVLLFCADLSKANLNGADLTGAILEKAVLYFADLRECRVSNFQLSKCFCLENATLPNGEIYPHNEVSLKLINSIRIE